MHGDVVVCYMDFVEEMEVDMDMVMLGDIHNDSMKTKKWLNHKKDNLSVLTLSSFYLPSAT